MESIEGTSKKQNFQIDCRQPLGFLKDFFAWHLNFAAISNLCSGVYSWNWKCCTFQDFEISQVFQDVSTAEAIQNGRLTAQIRAEAGTREAVQVLYMFSEKFGNGNPFYIAKIERANLAMRVVWFFRVQKKESSLRALSTCKQCRRFWLPILA